MASFGRGPWRRWRWSRRSSSAFTGALFLRAGLVLIPNGMLNEFPEPTRYYGVARNFIETGIIPTTWREERDTASSAAPKSGLSWSVGVTTGFNSTSGMRLPGKARNPRWGPSTRSWRRPPPRPVRIPVR
ncbi:MAG: hypothetical protein U1F35_14760 [Steroidobacteraceae bacterium]